MELDQAKQHINEVVWFCEDTPDDAPEQVRIIRVTDRYVYVTKNLDQNCAPTPEELFPALPEELHFEKSGFEEM